MSVSALLFSCRSKHEYRDTGTVLYLDSCVYDQSKLIYPKVICTFPDTVVSHEAWMLDDSHVLCRMDNRRFSAFAVYDIDSKDRLAEYLQYGIGQGKVNYPNVRILDDSVVVSEYISNAMYIIPRNAGYDKAVEPVVRNFGFISVEKIPFKGGFVYLNPYWFENAGLGISNGEPRLVFSDGKTEVPVHEGKHQSTSVVQGHILYSPQAGKFAYVETTYSLVEIYDADLNLQKTVTGPDDYMPDYAYDERGIMFSSTSLPMSYVSSCSDAEHIYLLYEGYSSEHKLEVSARRGYHEADVDNGNKVMLLLVLDWNGKLVGSFRPQGVGKLSEISVDGNGKYLYASAVDDDMSNLSILRYKLRL